jgi:hypothetical protein
LSKPLSELMADFEAEHLANIARDEERRATPEAQAAAVAKRKAEFDRGVRLGWWDADGNLPEDNRLWDEEDEED